VSFVLQVNSTGFVGIAKIEKIGNPECSIKSIRWKDD